MRVHDSFDCARCGQCCASQDLIQLTTYELYRLAEYLKVSPVAFFQQHCTLGETSQNPSRHLYIRTIESRCPFLSERLCSVHPARPFSCRAYPMRTLRTPASAMKVLVRQRYPALERSCSLFRLGDEEVLAGDVDLLIDQTIAYAVDEICFNAIVADEVDLSVPARVAEAFLRDAKAREEALTFLESSGRSPMYRSIGRMAMALQAQSWGASLTFVREPSAVSLGRAERPGAYVLVATDAESVDAVRALLASPGLDCRTFSLPSAAGRTLISAVYASPANRKAVGFQVDLEEASLRQASGDGATPVYVFFVPEGEDALADARANAIGLPLNLGHL